MEKSEPTLVPQWLRSSGSINGAGSSGHHFHSDISSTTRNRSSRSINDKDSTHSQFLDRSTSSNSKRSLNSSSSKHPYSSFTRSHRDKNHDKEKERSSILELWESNSSDPLGSLLTSRVEKNNLRHSQSLASRKPGELVPPRTEDKKNGVNNIHNNANGVLSGGNNLNGVQKAAFEKDFPSLGTEEKQVGRVPSPGLSSVVQCLPICHSTLLSGEKWTSALAEVPAIIAINGVGNSSSQQTGCVTLSTVTLGANTGLNMAEALSQGPARARTTSQLPDKTQRLEELAVKQSRQLIPVTPTMPKTLVSSSDKMKQQKSVGRASEMVVTAKCVQQQPYSSQLTNHPRGGRDRSDAPNMSHAGKFLVLRSVATSPKDAPSLANIAGGKVANEQPSVSPLSSLPSTSSSIAKLPAIEEKAAALTLNSRPTTEKKLSMSQAQSRSDFFNLMRKKTSPKTTALKDFGVVLSSSNLVDNTNKAVRSAPVSSVFKNDLVTSNGDPDGSHSTHDKAQQCSDRDNLCLNETIYPDEEEAAFLRSLGWDENAGEDEGLTEEEINAFYREYIKLKPSLKMYKGALPAHIPSDLVGKSGAAATESSACELEAQCSDVSSIR